MWPVCAAHCRARCRKSCCAAVRPAPRVRPPTQHASRSPDTTHGLPPWLLTWDAAMTATRIRMGSKILLFLVVCMSASSRDGGGDGDASCDGAFDIYFVLDRWVETDGRVTAGGPREVRRDSLRPLHVWACLVRAPLRCTIQRLFLYFDPQE